MTQCQQIVKNTEATVQRFDGLVASVSAATQDIVTAHAALKATAQPLQDVADRTATLISSVDRQVATMGAAAESLQTTSKHLNDVQDTLAFFVARLREALHRRGQVAGEFSGPDQRRL